MQPLMQEKRSDFQRAFNLFYKGTENGFPLREKRRIINQIMDYSAFMTGEIQNG